MKEKSYEARVLDLLFKAACRPELSDEVGRLVDDALEHWRAPVCPEYWEYMCLRLEVPLKGLLGMVEKVDMSDGARAYDEAMLGRDLLEDL